MRAAIVAALIVTVVVVAAFSGYLVGSGSLPGGQAHRHYSISIDSLIVCDARTKCGLPTILAHVLMNGSSLLSAIAAYVNGTFESDPFQNPTRTVQMCTDYVSTPNETWTCAVSPWQTITQTVLARELSVAIPRTLLPVIKGEWYTVTLVAEWQDGSSASAAYSAVAP